MAKRYFAEHQVDFKDYDVSMDREALKRMVSSTGQYGVPVITVGDQSMVGWDAGEFKRLVSG
jgi:glutaredoxin